VAGSYAGGHRPDSSYGDKCRDFHFITDQYYFGAGTGGANTIEGLIEISLELFFAGSIAALFGAFPEAIIGAMMLMVGIELTKFAGNVRWNRDLIALAATLIVSLAANMAYGFISGVFVHYITHRGEFIREQTR